MTDETQAAQTGAQAKPEPQQLVAELVDALVEAKRELWVRDRHAWNLADFKNFAVVQQIDAALAKARAQ